MSIVVALAALALLSADFALLPTISVAKHWVLARWHSLLGTDQWWPADPFVITIFDCGGEPLVYDLRSPFTSEARRDCPTYRLMYFTWQSHTGWWAPTWQPYGELELSGPKGEEWPEPVRAALREFLLMHLEFSNYQRILTRFDAHPRNGELIVRGYVHNGLSLLVASVFCVSASFTVESSRAIARVRRGRCRRCRYDITTTRGGVCPECGTPIAGADA